MTYYLTREQFDKIWNPPKNPPDCHWTSGRINWWNIYMESKWNITYDEVEAGREPDHLEPGYWGMLEGEEKYINWFLLQL
jgi:hypothetical protein